MVPDRTNKYGYFYTRKRVSKVSICSCGRILGKLDDNVPKLGEKPPRGC